MVTRLELVSDPSGAPQDRHLSQPRVVLGRGPEADWSFGDQAVSRRHAAIYHSPDHDEIEDLGSKWGTLVNGTRVQGRRTLRPGDLVQLASVRLRYVEDHLGSAMATEVSDPQPANVAFDVSIMVMVAGAATRSCNSDGTPAAPPIPEVLGFPVFALAFGIALVGMA